MVMAARREQSNEGLVAAGFSAMLQRPVITQQEYEKRRHEPEFAKVEELNYERLSETVYTPAAGSFGDIFSENGVMINIRLTSLTGKVCVLNVREDSYVEELQVLFEEKENLSGYHGRLAFVYKDREIQEGHKLSEYQTVTVDELKQRTQHETGLEIVHQRLIFNVTQLKDGELLSSYCGMGDNATVTVVHRLNGGSNRVVDPSVQRCKGPCVITSVVYDEPECVVMPCGHVIHPDQLVEFYHSEVCNYHKLEILCFMPGCNQIFNMEFLVKCGATQEELNLLSKGMAVNICAFNRDNSIQHCPECMCYCERISERQNVVRCSQCTQKNGKPFDFCSLCSLPWTSGHQCCKVNETLDILAKCEETTINGVKCPGIRLCPKCGVLIEHKEACKHMTCLMCKQEFCFVCLRLKTSSWQCGSHNSPCEPAPRQTAIVGAK